MTEDQIERIAERKMNGLDRQLMSGKLSQNDYDREVMALDKWAQQRGSIMSLRSYQAIMTKYIGPSNTKGSRIKASAAAGSITVHLDHSLNIENNHAAAAKALAEKMDWAGKYYMGGLPDDRGYCFVCAASNDETLAFEV